MEEKLCIALGDFDGVHLGHRLLLKTAVKNDCGFTPAVYTFSENCKGARVITSQAEKEKLLRDLGIKKVIFDDFEKVRKLSPREFAVKILFKSLNAGAVVCGRDFRFGENAKGDVDMLRGLCGSYGVKLYTVEQYLFMNEKLSSSNIRSMIEAGDMQLAAKALGRDFSITGKVAHGKRLGSENKVPTVNIPIENNRVLPAFGVYVTKTHIKGKVYSGVSNVGVRPSVEDTDKPNIETNVFDFCGDIYGEEITVKFVKMLRAERKFNDKEQLFDQIRRDITAAKAYFNGEN